MSKTTADRDDKKFSIKHYLESHPKAKPETVHRQLQYPATLTEVVGLIEELKGDELDECVRRMLAVLRCPVRYVARSCKVTVEYVEQVRADLVAELSQPTPEYLGPTEAVKAYLAAHPKAKPHDVARALQKEGYNVTSPFVTMVKRNLRKVAAQ